jgi:hypothetical protein
MDDNAYILVEKVKVHELASTIYDVVCKFKAKEKLNGAELISAMFEAIYILARLEAPQKKEA